MTFILIVLNAVIAINCYCVRESWAYREYGPKYQNIELFPDNLPGNPVNFTQLAEKIKRSGIGNTGELNIAAPSPSIKGFERHQIYKRNLNRDYPNKAAGKNISTSVDEENCQGKRSARSNLINVSGGLFKSELDNYEEKKPARDAGGKEVYGNNIVYNRQSNEEDVPLKDGNPDRIKTMNDTTRITSRNSDPVSDLEEGIDDASMANYDDSEGEIAKNDNVKLDSDNCEKSSGAVDKDAISDVVYYELIDNEPVKRELTGIQSETSSSSSRAINDEINKVYKDISDNVRLLTKLRDRESQISKSPSKKRCVIVDNQFNQGSNPIAKRCNHEFAVEMDTNRKATPDKLEHIERKTEEEILQVNVPLKCSH